MSEQTYLTTEELAARIKYDSRTIRDRLKDSVLLVLAGLRLRSNMGLRPRYRIESGNLQDFEVDQPTGWSPQPIT